MISLAETEGVWSESYVHISNHRGSWPQVIATAIYLDNMHSNNDAAFRMSWFKSTLY